MYTVVGQRTTMSSYGYGCGCAGRTPPCSQALVAAKIARVVVGMVDPDPRVSGGGLKTCHDAGIEVVCIGGALL
jgi:diaminohydroxyphosphoribosylaminopyrimidine deaminase/5-amino-6-(5-phosphoribosylamino)uracil reductase